MNNLLHLKIFLIIIIFENRKTDSNKVENVMKNFNLNWEFQFLM